jgi:hypothetical protein
VKVTTYLHIVPRLKNAWDLYLHSSNTPSWRGAQLKHREKFTYTLPYFTLLYFTFTICIFLKTYNVCEHDIEPAGSIKGGEFLDQLSDC